MFCSKCGIQIDTNQKFCTKCGFKTGDVNNNSNFNELLSRAQAGDANAQASVGEIYYQGNNGIKKNYDDARKWFEKAAGQNNPLAYWGLACLYYYGDGGFSTDYVVALEYVKKSIEQNCPEGMNLMGVMYEHGKGVLKNEVEAYKWYRMAAERGVTKAQKNLGVMYETGKGVLKNEVEACRWYRMAAEKGDAQAQKNLGVMYETGKGVLKNEVEAFKWYRLAAEQGHALAQRNLGRLYSRGKGVIKNEAEAIKWVSKSVEQGNAAGQNELAYFYENGIGVQKNLIMAYKWYCAAAEQDYTWAQGHLGWMYANGVGVQKNINMALNFYNKAVDADADYYKSRADLYQSIGRYDEAIKDLFEYYKQQNPSKKCRKDGTYNDVFTMNYNHLISFINSLVLKDEHFVYYSPCYLVLDEHNEQRVYNGTSKIIKCGTIGLGYVAFTDKGLYIFAFQNLTRNNPLYKKSKISFLFGVYDRSKVIDRDYSMPINYDSIISIGLDEYDHVVIKTLTEIQIMPLISDEEKMICAAIKIGKAGQFTRTKNAEVVSNKSPEISDFATKLTKLKELADSGIITNAEFEQKKKDILDNIGK